MNFKNACGEGPASFAMMGRAEIKGSFVAMNTYNEFNALIHTHY